MEPFILELWNAVSWAASFLQLLLHSYKGYKSVQKCRETRSSSHSAAKPKWKLCRSFRHWVDQGQNDGLKVVFWSALRAVSTFFFHPINLYFKWLKVTLCFVNKQNPTFGKNSSDAKTVALKIRGRFVTEQSNTSRLLSIWRKHWCQDVCTHCPRESGQKKSLRCRSQLLTAPKFVTSEGLRTVMVCDCLVLLLLVPRLKSNTK